MLGMDTYWHQARANESTKTQAATCDREKYFSNRFPEVAK